MAPCLLETKNIAKVFPGGVRALDGVNIRVEEKSIHALCGENGAGKSTLMNILSGVYPYGTYEGKIMYKGKECRFSDVRDSEKEGIVIIHQELALIPSLSVMENIFLSNERQTHGVMDWERTRMEAVQIMERVGLHEEPDVPVNKLGMGKQQLVEIAKALSKDAKLLILDEPTASLNDEDSEKLLDLLLDLREKSGMTAIIISHKLNEITRIADKLTVIRDGKSIASWAKGKDDFAEDRIIKSMVGREITDRYPPRPNRPIGDICLEVKDWCVGSPDIADRLLVDHVSFHVRRGEVVGFAGLMGAGRTALAMSLFGKSCGRGISGTILKDGKEIKIESVADAIENGIAYVTEDRKGKGLILMENIRENITLPTLKKFSSPGGLINEEAEANAAEEYVQKLHIKAPGIFQKTRNLSGGNQQKVMLARWICANPDVLILDEPTRGIDAGAKYEIYCIINELAKQGKSIIVISSEMPEILGLSDRIYVMHEGCFAGELPVGEASQEGIMRCIMQANSAKPS